jgi:gamma-tubulin complex component 3
MIEQSLCHHLQAQLTEYYRLVAVLESQMSGAPHVSGDKEDKTGEGAEETGLTLKRLDVWINEWRLRMRMMSVCIEGARGIRSSAVLFAPLVNLLFIDAQGGALVNLIHGYTDNGDPFVRKFTDQLLEEVCHYSPSC